MDKALRPLVRSIANPLKLGEMGLDATHFVLGQHWKNHFTKKVAETGAAIEVRQLRKWIDEPKPMGLPKEAENLVILIHALQTNHSFFIHGAPFNEATLGNLPDMCVLRAEKLPPQDQWDKRDRACGLDLRRGRLPTPELEQRLVAGHRRQEEGQRWADHLPELLPEAPRPFREAGPTTRGF